MIDLGLSVKWAAGNLGSEMYYKAGDYYAWGELTPKTNFTKDNYSQSSISSDLSLAQDAVNVKLGGSYRLPTKTELTELINDTVNSYVDSYRGIGASGYIFYKKIDGKDNFEDYSYNDTHIFIPGAGYMENEQKRFSGRVMLWTSTYLSKGNSWTLYAENGFISDESSCSTYMGLQLRAVS